MFEIIKESEKALQISVKGVVTWIPKSWVLKDGTLNDMAKEKIYDGLVEQQYTLQSNIDKGDCVIAKETEKALCIVWLQSLYGGRDITSWIPKSMKDNYSFISKKLVELGGRQPSIRFAVEGI